MHATMPVRWRQDGRRRARRHISRRRARPHHPSLGHVSSTSVDYCHVIAMVMDLSAKIHGAEMCYIGAMIHGVELGVYFLKTFQKRRICEILSPKKLKSKKFSHSPSLLSLSTPSLTGSHHPGSRRLHPRLCPSRRRPTSAFAGRAPPPPSVARAKQ
jgi:hypothetical protein